MQAKRKKKISRHQGKTKEKLNIKIIYIFTILIVISIFFIKVIINRNEYSATKSIATNSVENIFQKFFNEKTFENLNIQDIKITVKDGVAKFNATVQNKSDVDFKSKEIYIIFKQENGDEIIRFKYTLNDIPKGREDSIALVSTVDLTLANDFCIE